MRLIDADRALEIVHTQGIVHPNAYHLTNYATLILQEAPTVDAMPVVRCKDCIHSYDDLCGICCTYCGYLDCVVYPHFYCAGGKRKDGDGNG